MTPSRLDRIRRERARATRETMIHLVWVVAAATILYVLVATR